MPTGSALPNDDKKAAEWYQLAADRGDREAMFALAMFRMTGRGGPRDRERRRSCSPPPPSSAMPSPPTISALLYLEGQLFPQDFARAAELFRIAADAGNPEAQYALATFYKEGRGVPKDAARGGAPARRRGARRATPTPRSNTPSRCSTAPASPRTKPPPATISCKAARKGSPIAQNRLAACTRPAAACRPTGQAVRWHLIAKAGGDNDLFLDDFMRKQKPEDRAAGRRQRPSPGSRA